MAQVSSYSFNDKNFQHEKFGNERSCQSWIRKLYRLAGIENPYSILNAPRANETGLKMWNDGLRSSSDIDKNQVYSLKAMGLDNEEIIKCQSILDIINEFNNQTIDEITHKILSQERLNALRQQIQEEEHKTRLLRIQLDEIQKLDNLLQNHF